jgi:uncharacterized membrane protein
VTSVDHATVDRAEHGSLGAERLSLFSDAVVAIAITLLALDLHVPTGTTNAALWHDLVDHSTDYIGFLISFAVIGNYWFLHHRTFSRVTRLGGALARWNMLWLLMIVLTPFATRVLVADGAFAARLAIYAVVQALASLFFLLAVVEIDRHGLAGPDADRGFFTRSYLRLSVLATAFLVSIPFAFLTHWAYLCWLVIPFAARVQHIFDALRRRAAR